MTVYETTQVESTEPANQRDIRALTQYLTVLPDAPDLYRVVSQSGREYVVDTREDRCTCPDHKYRNNQCKHIRRVAYATGERDVPPGVNADPLLGEHVPSTPQVATDGGQVINHEPRRVEYTRHVEHPDQGGAPYIRCGGCGAELLESLGGKDSMIHRESCPAGEGR